MSAKLGHTEGETSNSGVFSLHTHTHTGVYVWYHRTGEPLTFQTLSAGTNLSLCGVPSGPTAHCSVLPPQRGRHTTTTTTTITRRNLLSHIKIAPRWSGVHVWNIIAAVCSRRPCNSSLGTNIRLLLDLTFEVIFMGSECFVTLGPRVRETCFNPHCRIQKIHSHQFGDQVVFPERCTLQFGVRDASTFVEPVTVYYTYNSAHVIMNQNKMALRHCEPDISLEDPSLNSKYSCRQNSGPRCHCKQWNIFQVAC